MRLIGISICFLVLSFNSFCQNDLEYISGSTDISISSEVKMRLHSRNDHPGLLGISGDVEISSSGNGAFYKDKTSGRVLYLLNFLLEDNAGLSMIIEQIHLSTEAEIRLIGNGGGYFHKYTFNDIADHKLFLAPVSGQKVTLEIIMPEEDMKDFYFSIHKIYIMRSGFEEFRSGSIGFGESLPCHRNINCPEGDNYQTYKRGICKILMPLEEGLAFCTGTLINNTGDQAIPYVLTAYHCDNGYTPYYNMYQFIFDYEGEGCENPINEPEYRLIIGAEVIAGYQDTDARLFRITGNIPSDYNLYLNGWTRDTNYIHAALIHHPFGDIKKISLDNDPPTIHPVQINWSGQPSSPPRSHLHMTFDIGAQQPGSSGAPLLNEDGYIVGQLHGGLANCGQNRRGYVGRFSLSWDSGETSEERLKDWLDPDNKGWMYVEGREFSQVSTLKVKVRDIHGRHIRGVRVTEGIPPVPAIELEDGYLFSLGNKTALQIRLSKSTGNLNGITPVDLVIQRLLVLGRIEADPEMFRAADVNNDGLLDNEDIRELSRLLLNKEHKFPGAPSWIFIPNMIHLTDIGINDEVDILGIKLGDLNFSADPAY